MTTSEKPANQHIGRKIGRLRELRGIKQDDMAVQLGVSQKTVSRIEQSEEIEDEVLAKIAVILGVPVDAIKNFSEEAVINIISNTFSDFKDNASAINHNCTLNFNPIDKILELVEENKNLYERLLASEKEKNELLKGK